MATAMLDAGRHNRTHSAPRSQHSVININAGAKVCFFCVNQFRLIISLSGDVYVQVIASHTSAHGKELLGGESEVLETLLVRAPQDC